MPLQRGSAGTQVASATSVANPSNLSPPIPTHEVGDLLLCYTFCRSATPTVATPSGWTSLLNVTGTNGRLVVFGRIATVTNTATPTVTWSGLTTGNSGTPVLAQCSVFYQMAATITGIVDVTGTVENGAASTTAAASGAAITTLANYDLVLALSMRLDDAGTWTPPTGFTSIGAPSTASGSDMSGAWSYLDQVTAGSSSPADYSLSGASSFASTGVLLALKGVAPPIGAKLHTAIVDDFDPPDGFDLTIWRSVDFVNVMTEGFTPTESQLKFFSKTSYPYLQTGNSEPYYDLQDSYLHAKVTPAAVGNGGQEFSMELIAKNTSGATKDSLTMVWTSTDLLYRKYVDGAIVASSSSSINLNAHRWGRIRGSADGLTAYFDTSYDGITWTERWNVLTSGIDINRLWVSFAAGWWGTETDARPVYLDSVNAAPLTPAPLSETLLDDFNRSNGTVNAGAGGSIWTSKRVDSALAVQMKVIGNAVGYDSATVVSGVLIAEAGTDFDLVMDAVVAPVFDGSTQSVSFFFSGSEFGTSTYDAMSFTILELTANEEWRFNPVTDGSVGTVDSVPSNIRLGAGDSVWVARRGTNLTAYRRPNGSAVWETMLFAIDSLYERQGAVGLRLSGPNQRWDNLRGGPFIVLAPPKIVAVV